MLIEGRIELKGFLILFILNLFEFKSCLQSELESHFGNNQERQNQLQLIPKMNFNAVSLFSKNKITRGQTS